MYYLVIHTLDHWRVDSTGIQLSSIHPHISQHRFYVKVYAQYTVLNTSLHPFSTQYMKREVFPACSLTVAIAAVATGLVVAYIAGLSFHRTVNNCGESDDDENDDVKGDTLPERSTSSKISNYYSFRRNETAKTTDSHQSSFPTVVPPISKKGMKKQMKYERKVQNRKMKKQKERQIRHQEALSAGRDIEKEQELVAQRTMSGDGWRRRQVIWETEKLPYVMQSFHICIDCSYEPYMTKKETTSLAAQIRCCYAYNKRNAQPCQMVVTNLSMQQSPETLQLLQQEKGYSEWNNRAYMSTALSPHEFYGSSHNDLATVSGVEHKPPRITKIVYLTSDSENTLLTLDNDAVYVIGGIVDRNRHKGIAYARALSLRGRNDAYDQTNNHDAVLSITTAKLPLMEYIAHMPSTPVLTINHVFHILLQYRNFNNDWNAAFQAVLPARKEAQYIYQ